MPTCREAVRLQSDALNQPLGLIQRMGLRLHLLVCVFCARYGKHLNVIRAAARRSAESPKSGPAMSNEVRERIKQRLRADGK